MLRLRCETDKDWLPLVLSSMDELLVDHAHLEKKAASQAMSLLFRYPDKRSIQRPMAALAREELDHFELVLEHIERRGTSFGPRVPCPYAARLRSIERKSEPQRLIDSLLFGAVIEARSCERMKILSEALEDTALQRLYKGLLAAEARHHQVYLDLALSFAPESQVMARLDEITEHEAQILGSPPREPKMHG